MNAPTEPVVVTGAGSGIGAAVVRLLVEAGTSCVALDRDQEALQTATKDLPKQRLFRAAIDICEPQALATVLQAAEAELGPLFGLVHAAGIMASGSLLDPGLSQARFAEVQRVNVEGTWVVGRAVAHHLMGRRRGSLVFVTSNAGSTPRVNMAAYSASKAAALMLSRCFALELGPHGVRSNSVSPGSTDTKMLRELLVDGDTSGVISGDPLTFRTGIPLGRVGTAEDVAKASLFLLSDAAAHITGADLRIDGGATWT